MRIGITGGIGCGKSYVCRLMEKQFSLPVYDCDREAKRLMNGSPALRRALQALVGAEAYDAQGYLNRTIMSRYLFAEAAHVEAVNTIVHPAVKADFLSWAERQPTDVVVESAILVEAGLRECVDRLVVVEAPLELRIARAMQRDGATAGQVEARIRHQLPAEELRAYADFVVINDGRDLLPQLEPIVQS